MTSSTRIAVICSIIVGLPALFASTTFGQTSGGERALQSAIAGQMAQGPSAEGAYVVDLSSGHVVFSDRPGLPA